MNIKKHIPNAITCCNLLCGCIAIVQAMSGNLVWAAYLVGLAAIFDFFDGFAARLLKVSSPIGKDLDSLADMVTFGVVPGIVMFKMISFSTGISDFYTSMDSPSFYTYVLPYLAFLIPVFSAIRLAKFNNDPRQSDSFIGLPTPANAIFICSCALILALQMGASASIDWAPKPMYSDLPINTDTCSIQNSTAIILLNIFKTPVLIGLIIVLSLLLVSELPLFALKFKHFKWKGNEVRFIFLILCIVMLATLQLIGIPLCIILYVLLSVINNFITKRRATIAG